MKSAEQFWSVITIYNHQTVWIQIPMTIILLSLVLMVLVIRRECKEKGLNVLPEE